jgi:hypothetical protein
MPLMVRVMPLTYREDETQTPAGRSWVRPCRRVLRLSFLLWALKF